MLGITGFILSGLSGCSSTNNPVDKPIVQTTAKFNFNDISLEVVELVSPDIKYHTKSEMKAIVLKQVKTSLEEANLLTNDSSMNSLDIKITYHRRFVGDETPIPSDSLGYPSFDYEINVNDGDKLLTTVSRENLKYQGGFAMNLKVIAGLLREKSDETVFIEALSNAIVKSIKQLKK